MKIAYSLHLGSNKNNKNSARKSASKNISGTTSLSNNSIQNATQLSRVDNYRKNDYKQDDKDKTINYIEQVNDTNKTYESIKDLLVSLSNIEDKINENIILTENNNALNLRIKILERDIPHMLQLFDYPENIRKLVYTTNPIESLNSALRKTANGKVSFVNEEVLSKVLYLRTKKLQEKWNKTRKNNWQIVLNELYLTYEERINKYIEI